MKKLLSILFTLGTLFAMVPYALGATKMFQVNTLSGGSLTTGIVSYWNMQGNSNDYWGSNNGTDTSVTYGTSYGKVAQGAGFNGTTSKIVSGSNSGFSGDATFSVAAWIYVQTFTGQSTLSFSPGSSSGNRFSMVIGDKSFYGDLSIDGNGTMVGTATNIMTANNWYHCVITHSSGNLNSGNTKFYINGTNYPIVQTYLPSTSLNLTNAPFYFGEFSNTQYLNGDMDEVGVWSRVLSAQEISDLYNGGAGQTMCNGTGGPVCGGGRHKIIIISSDFKFENPFLALK